MVASRKDDPVNMEYEAKAKNLLEGELKRRGVTYAQLAEKLAGIGVQVTERNVQMRIGRGGFSAAFLLQCLDAINAADVQPEPAGQPHRLSGG